MSEEDKMQQWPLLALILAENGWTKDALQLTEEVLRLQKSKLGEDHPETLGSMANLANRYSEAGRRSEALQLTEEVLKLRKSKLGEDHPDTLTSMANLAIHQITQLSATAVGVLLTFAPIRSSSSMIGWILNHATSTKLRFPRGGLVPEYLPVRRPTAMGLYAMVAICKLVVGCHVNRV
jgi:hypothetical protein